MSVGGEDAKESPVASGDLVVFQIDTLTVIHRHRLLLGGCRCFGQGFGCWRARRQGSIGILSHPLPSTKADTFSVIFSTNSLGFWPRGEGYARFI